MAFTAEVWQQSAVVQGMLCGRRHSFSGCVWLSSEVTECTGVHMHVVVPTACVLRKRRTDGTCRSKHVNCSAGVDYEVVAVNYRCATLQLKREKSSSELRPHGTLTAFG
jgi:hypothetical protein